MWRRKIVFSCRLLLKRTETLWSVQTKRVVTQETPGKGDSRLAVSKTEDHSHIAESSGMPGMQDMHPCKYPLHSCSGCTR